MWKQSFVCVTGLLASACQEAPGARESVKNASLRQSLTPTAQGSVFSGAFYDFEVVGMSGNGQVHAAGQYPVLGEGPSINDQGRVAFTGTKVANGDSIFLDSGSNPLSLTGSAYDQYSDFPRINSAGLVACQQSDTYYGMGVYLWSAPDTFTNILYSGGNSSYSFYPLSDRLAFNDSGQIAVSTYNNEVGTRTAPGAPLYQRSTHFATPSVAMDNAGHTLFFDLDFSKNDPRTLLLSPNDLSTTTVIADDTCFSNVGDFPGISPDGRIIVFYGESNGTCAISPEADTAEGIFASLDLGGSSRTLVRLSGMKVEDPTSTTGNQDGTCDAGETCVSGELGFNAQGGPFTFNTYDFNSRIGVAHQEKGAAGLDGDSFVFTLVGAPSAAHPGHFSAQTGIWTARADVSLVNSALKLTLATPTPVVQVGDSLGDQVVSHFGSVGYGRAYPDIANARTNRTGTPRQQAVGDHRLAFFFEATSGESLIVRAEHVTHPTGTVQGSSFQGRNHSLEVVGMTGNGEVHAAGQYSILDDGPSINDQGRVAFTGAKVANGSSIFLDSGSNPLSLTGSPYTQYFGFPRINSAGQVACVQSLSYDMYLAIWSAPDTETTMLDGPTVSSDFYPLSSIVGFNDSGQTAFSAMNAALGTRSTPTALINQRNTSVPTSSVAMDNAGHTLFFDFDWSSTVDPRTLVLASNNLSTTTVIADGNCFSNIGDFPGISPDGRIIVFYGESNGTCAISPEADTAEGIFASLDLGGSSRTLVRLSGMKVEDPTSTTGNQDGTCDAGETCVSGELGFNAQGGPFTFASYQSDARIGVAHQENLPTGLDGDSFVFTLVGAPSAAHTGHFSAQNGIWTARVDVSLVNSALKLTLGTPLSVIQQGDSLGNQVISHFGSPYGLAHPDIANARTTTFGQPRQQAAGDHRLVFHAVTNSNEAVIVRAEHL